MQSSFTRKQPTRDTGQNCTAEALRTDTSQLPDRSGLHTSKADQGRGKGLEHSTQPGKEGQDLLCE